MRAVQMLCVPLLCVQLMLGYRLAQQCYQNRAAGPSALLWSALGGSALGRIGLTICGMQLIGW